MPAAHRSIVSLAGARQGSVESGNVDQQDRSFDAIVEHHDLVRGRAIWRGLYMVNRFFEQEGYVASVKAATNLQGLAIGDPRPPILPLPIQKVEALGKLLEAAGLRGAVPAGHTDTRLHCGPPTWVS